MSATQIPTGLPNPFDLYPSYVAIPPSRTLRISKNQDLGALNATANAGRMTGSFVCQGDGTKTITLSSADRLLAAYGGAAPVQVNDYFVVDFYNNGAGSVSIAPGTSGSGGPKTIAANSAGYVLIQFTNTTAGTVAYTIF